MKLENRVVSYLMKYGNTRESDLAGFVVRETGCNQANAERIIQCMVVKGKVHRIVHSRLEPPETYVSLLEPLPPETMRGLIEVSSAKQIEREKTAILREAATIAEQKIREAFNQDTDSEL